MLLLLFGLVGANKNAIAKLNILLCVVVTHYCVLLFGLVGANKNAVAKLNILLRVVVVVWSGRSKQERGRRLQS